MKKAAIAIIMLMALFMLLAVPGNSSGSSGQNVLVLNLHEQIDPGSSHFISSQLASVTSSNTRAVIIDMNTPGGLLQNMLEIVNAINITEGHGIPVYTYIPADSAGASAGSYIAMATDGIYMGSGSAIGPSTPIVVGGSALEQNHTQAYFEAYMVSLANAHGRNATAAGIMVSQDIAYSENQAVSIGLVNGYSPNLTVLLTSLNLSGYQVITANPSYYDNFLSFLSNSVVDGLLILIGSIAILADIYHGTAILTVLGIVMIGLGLVGAEIIGASIMGIIMILLGSMFIFLEAKTGHGVALISGVVVSIFGTFMLASPYLASNPGYSPSPFGVMDYFSAITIAAIAVVFGLFIRRVAVSLKSRKITGSEALIGKIVTVKKDLNPTGWVSMEGVQWKARTKDYSEIPAGGKAEIIDREGLVLIVKKVE